MPLSRLASRLIAEEKRAIEEEERRAQDVTLQGFIMAHVVQALLIEDKPMPQTEAEQKRKTANTEILKAKHQRQEHRERLQWHMERLPNFAKWFGMEVWGETEEGPAANTSEEDRLQAFKEWEAAAEADFWRKAEEQLGRNDQ